MGSLVRPHEKVVSWRSEALDPSSQEAAGRPGWQVAASGERPSGNHVGHSGCSSRLTHDGQNVFVSSGSYSRQAECLCQFRDSLHVITCVHGMSVRLYVF